MPSIKRPTSSLRQVFGAQLREARKARDMTIFDLAYVAHVDWSYVTKIENGRQNASLDIMDALAHAVGVHLSDLLNDRKTLTTSQNET